MDTVQEFRTRDHLLAKLGWRARSGQDRRSGRGQEPGTAPLRERITRLALHHLLPVGGYLILTLILTYPLILHFTTRLPGAFSDGWQNYWNYWWLSRAVTSGVNPYWTPLLYAPYGAPLYVHTLNLFSGAVTLPVQWLFGVVPAYNAVVLISFTLSGYFTYLLVARITGHRWAGIVGGVVYAFSSYHLMQLMLEHSNLYASQWFPAYILCLVIACDTTGRRRTLAVLFGAVGLLLALLCDWQYGILAAVFTLLYVAYRLISERALRPLLVAACIGTFTLILAAPLLIPALRQVRDGSTVVQFEYLPALFSADLLTSFVPSPLSATWGSLLPLDGVSFVAPEFEKSVFLGYVPLALGIIGLWRRPRSGGFWAVAGLSFLILALGPDLQVAGRAVLGPDGAPIPLPYRLVQLIPGVNISRLPVRFVLGSVLCLAVLAGIGCVEVRAWLQRRNFARLGRFLPAVLVPLILLEHSIAPVPLKAVEEPAFYRMLAASPEAGTVLEWPLSFKRSRSLAYQTIHGRPMIGGYLSRPLVYPIQLLPPFRERDYPTEDIVRSDAAAAGRWTLHFADVHWIVVLHDDPRLDTALLPQFLSRYAEPEPIYADGQMTVYRPRPPEPISVFVGIDEEATGSDGSGWYEREKLPGGGLMRWLNSAGPLTAWNLTSATFEADLRFEAWSFSVPRRVEVSVDGQVVGQFVVAERQAFTVPMTLTPGQHRIVLRSLDPPLAPSAIGQGSDQREVAIGVTEVTLQPR
jgi:hypothetical protein